MRKSKKNKAKYDKKGKGFIKFTNNTNRLTRAQKRDLENNFNEILNELTSSRKNKLNKTMAKFQGKIRGKFTRKNFDQLKLKLLKEKEKYLKKLKGPNSSKRLQELPIPILNEILNNILKKDEDNYEDVKNILIILIISSNISEKFNECLKKIIENQNLILIECQKIVKKIDHIIILLYGNPGLDTQGERDSFLQASQLQSISVRNSMNKILEKIDNLRSKKNKIIEYLNKIYSLIYTNDDNDLLKELINIINVDWHNEIIIAEHSRNITNIQEKIKEYKDFLKSNINEIEKQFEDLLKNKITHTRNLDEINKITEPIYDYISKLNELFL
jgi:hypothetical protein